jgi:hypothetical protein
MVTLSYLDAISDNTIWEFKCTDTLSLEHFLQLIIYAYVYKHKFPDSDIAFKILNIRNGELYEMIEKKEIIDQIMDMLFAHKYASQSKESDDQFVINVVSSISNHMQTSSIFHNMGGQDTCHSSNVLL